MTCVLFLYVMCYGVFIKQAILYKKTEMGRRKRRTNRLLKNAPADTNTKRDKAAESSTDRESATNWNARDADTVSANIEEISKLPICEFVATANSYCFAEIHAIIREIGEKSQEYDRAHGLSRDNCDAQINSSATEIIPSSNEHFLLGCNTVDAGPPVLQSRKNCPCPFNRGESSKKMVGDGGVSNNTTSSYGKITESNAVLYPIQRLCTEGPNTPFLLNGVSCMGSVVGAASCKALSSKENFHNHLNDKDLERSKKPEDDNVSQPLEMSENLSADIKSGGLMQEVENHCELAGMSYNSPHDLKTDSLCSLDIVSKTQDIHPVATDFDVDELVNLIKRDWKITTDAESITHPLPVNINKRNTETPKTTGSMKIPRVRIFPDSQSDNISYAPGIIKDDISTDKRRKIHVSADHSDIMALQFPHEWPRARLEEDIDADGHRGKKRSNKTSETSISRAIPQNSHCFNENVNIDIPVFNFLDLPEEQGSLSPGTRELLEILSTTSVDLLIPSLS